MCIDVLSVEITSIIVHLTLPMFIVHYVLFVPAHHIAVLIAASFDLIGKIAVLVGDSNLLLQADLLIVKFTEAIFEHLGFNLLLLELKLLLELA